MKNLFKKAVSLTIALSIVAAMSVSAFATEEGDTPVLPTANYNSSTASVTVEDYETVGAGQYAVAVVKEGFDGTNDELIYYVNQSDADGIPTILANMLVKGELTPGNYEVRIGTNATIEGEEQAYTCIDLVVEAPSTGGDDFITSTDTDKGAIVTDVADVSHNSMGLSKGNKIVSLALNATEYPNAGAAVNAYGIVVVDVNGNAISGATVYYSAERAKYVALIPSTVTDYKFKVVEDATVNSIITKYGNMNEDENGRINTTDFTQFMKVFKVLEGNVASKDAKKALIADVSGDGKVNTTDFTQFMKAFKSLDYTFKVLSK